MSTYIGKEKPYVRGRVSEGRVWNMPELQEKVSKEKILAAVLQCQVPLEGLGLGEPQAKESEDAKGGLSVTPM